MVADFRDDTPSYSATVQAMTFDTSKYCSAVIDVGTQAGPSVDIDVLGEFALHDIFAGTLEAPTIHFAGGLGSTLNSAYVVPLRHFYTEFSVRPREKDLHGETVVFVTAIRCGATF